MEKWNNILINEHTKHKLCIIQYFVCSWFLPQKWWHCYFLIIDFVSFSFYNNFELGLNLQQLWATEKSTNLGHRKGVQIRCCPDMWGWMHWKVLCKGGQWACLFPEPNEMVHSSNCCTGWHADITPLFNFIYIHYALASPAQLLPNFPPSCIWTDANLYSLPMP